MAQLRQPSSTDFAPSVQELSDFASLFAKARTQAMLISSMAARAQLGVCPRPLVSLSFLSKSSHVLIVLVVSS